METMTKINADNFIDKIKEYDAQSQAHFEESSKTMQNKQVGSNYLHRHPMLESEASLDQDHVIVDKADWLEVLAFFKANPSLVKMLGT
jgi:hypothetical protein